MNGNLSTRTTECKPFSEVRNGSYWHYIIYETT